MRTTSNFGFLLIVFFVTLSFSSVYSQDEARVFLKGKVLYRNNNVPHLSVFNSTAESYTITNDEGEFSIEVKTGDQLVFTAVNYELRVITISDEILNNNRLVIEVKEKVQELEEVVVSPENQQKFLEVQNEEFKEFNYEIDRGTQVENVALSRAERGMQDGINFVNIFKAIFKKKDTGEETGIELKVSDVLRQVYDDEFFLVDLKLPKDKIDAFLVYVDDKVPSNQLLRRENEFELIEFLVVKSKEFMTETVGN